MEAFILVCIDLKHLVGDCVISGQASIPPDALALQKKDMPACKGVQTIHFQGL